MAESIIERFDRADRTLSEYERRIREGEELPLDETVDIMTDQLRELLRAYLDTLGRDSQTPGDDVLALWKAAVKDNPSLHTIRDNLREVVYYRNCLDQVRDDALPPNAEKQAVRTTRHVYLYLRTRCEQAGAVDKAEGVQAP
jgi:hypothetical protein